MRKPGYILESQSYPFLTILMSMFLIQWYYGEYLSCIGHNFRLPENAYFNVNDKNQKGIESQN